MTSLSLVILACSNSLAMTTSLKPWGAMPQPPLRASSASPDATPRGASGRAIGCSTRSASRFITSGPIRSDRG